MDAKVIALNGVMAPAIQVAMTNVKAVAENKTTQFKYNINYRRAQWGITEQKQNGKAKQK